MSLFKNQNFVILLGKQLGIDHELQQPAAALLQALVENQARRLLEIALKFTHNQNKEELSVQDIHHSAVYLGHRNIKFVGGEDKSHQEDNGVLVIDKICNSEDFIANQLKTINHIFRKPQIKARWVYLNGRIPRTEANIHIKNLNQINELKANEQQQRKKKFNIIRDTPISLLSIQQQQFFKSITSQLESGIQPSLQNNNINAIFPFLISYVLASKITDIFGLFMIQIVKNKFCAKHVEVHLHQILSYFMAYEGECSWEIGFAIADVVRKFGDKYPVLYNLYSSGLPTLQSYSTKIKKLAFEVSLGVNLNIEIQNLTSDIAKGVPFAKTFLYLINQCSRKLHYRNKYNEHLTQGLCSLEPQEFLNLTI